MFECMSTDGVNCFWRSSYDRALNDTKNNPATLKNLSAKWNIVPV